MKNYNNINSNTFFYKKKSINCSNKLIFLDKPIVMGVLNLTDNSFYSGSRLSSNAALVREAEKMLIEGATILDIGVLSTRPGGEDISESDERNKLLPALKAIKNNFPEVIVSVDTYRASIAKAAIEFGASIINDISGGTMDDKMFETIAEMNVPYILMHIQGTPKTMQNKPTYNNVTREVIDFLLKRLKVLKDLGVKDVIVDPGFGFGKTIAHNYQLLRELDKFGIAEVPILVGLSRKSMIYKALENTPTEALYGTIALNTIALLNGADILRVHDVKPAVEAIKLVCDYYLQ